MKPDPIRKNRKWLALLWLVTTGCSTESQHHGRFPFSMMEHPPAVHQDTQAKKMSVMMSYRASPIGKPGGLLAKLQPGDVIAFHMSHAEVWQYLKQGKIQKLPYELFSYGHIALVVPNPQGSGLRLLQLAMKQAVNAKERLDYLNDKSWVVYRPPAGSVDVKRLQQFTKRVIQTASDPHTAYDYAGILGLRNAPWQPDSLEQLGSKYSCATLVVAGLHYSGYQLSAVHRGGLCDIVTPRQVVESYGMKVTPSASGQ
jgi:hypothetical protein